MAGLRSVTGKHIVGKKIVGVWGEPKPNEKPVPRRQLVLITEDGAETVTCTEEVLNKVEVFKEYRFVLDNYVSDKKVKIVDVLVDDKK